MDSAHVASGWWRRIGGWSAVCWFCAAFALGTLPSMYRRMTAKQPVVNPSGQFGLWVDPPASDTTALPVYVAATLTNPNPPFTVGYVSTALQKVFMDRGLTLREASYDSSAKLVNHIRVDFDMHDAGDYKMGLSPHCPEPPRGNEIPRRNNGLQSTYSESGAFDEAGLRMFVQMQISDVLVQHC